jgi:hypothetical protein
MRGAPMKYCRKSDEQDPQSLVERCFPVYVAAMQNKQYITRRCAVYDARKTRRESRYHCEEYDVGLCVVPCFKIYHTQAHF